MNDIVRSITPDGRTGFDKYDQLWTWSEPDASGEQRGTMIRDVRGMTCKLCQKGWELTSASMQDQERFGSGWVVHKGCREGFASVNSFYDIQGMFIKAGYLFQMDEIPSQYPYSPPWQEITILQNDNDRTPVVGTKVVIGRRKRVWEIQAFGFGDLSPLFTDVEDTKGYATDPSVPQHYYIHAWTQEQAVDYLTRIRLTIPLDTGRTGWVHKTLPFIDLTKDQK